MSVFIPVAVAVAAWLVVLAVSRQPVNLHRSGSARQVRRLSRVGRSAVVVALVASTVAGIIVYRHVGGGSA